MRAKRYDEKTAAKLLDVVAHEGRGVQGACEKLGVPRRTVRWWATTKPDFAAALNQARKEGLEVLADQIITIGDEVKGCTDNAVVQAAKLRCDNRRWLLSKLNPGQYGDKVELSGTGGRELFPANPEAQIPRLMQVLAVLLPNTGNSELHNLATEMTRKLKKIEGPQRDLKGNGADIQED